MDRCPQVWVLTWNQDPTFQISGMQWSVWNLKSSLTFQISSAMDEKDQKSESVTWNKLIETFDYRSSQKLHMNRTSYGQLTIRASSYEEKRDRDINFLI